MTRLERKLILLAIILFALAIGVLLYYLKRKANERNVTVPVLVLAFIVGSAMTVYTTQVSVIDNSGPTTVAELDEKQQELLLAVRENPSSVKAWNQLGREYLLKQDYEKAYQAFSESRQVDYSALFASSDTQNNTPIDNEERVERLKWLTGLAEARILAQRGAIDEESEKFLGLALSLDAGHPKALWYGGLNAALKQNYSQAKVYWERLATQEPPGALGEVLRQRLSTLEQIIIEKDKTQTEATWELKLKIVVAEELLRTQTQQTRIFLSLRQEQGLPPVAAKQLHVEEVSAIVSLSDLDAIPAMRAQQSVDWDKPLRFDILWSPSGKVDEEGNIRFASMIDRANLKGVNEFVLDREKALK